MHPLEQPAGPQAWLQRMPKILIPLKYRWIVYRGRVRARRHLAKLSPPDQVAALRLKESWEHRIWWGES